MDKIKKLEDRFFLSVSEKMCTFAHIIFGFVSAAKITQRAESPNGNQPLFFALKKFYRTAIIFFRIFASSISFSNYGKPR